MQLPTTIRETGWLALIGGLGGAIQIDGPGSAYDGTHHVELRGCYFDGNVVASSDGGRDSHWL